MDQQRLFRPPRHVGIFRMWVFSSYRVDLEISLLLTLDTYLRSPELRLFCYIFRVTHASICILKVSHAQSPLPTPRPNILNLPGVVGSAMLRAPSRMLQPSITRYSRAFATQSR